MQEKRSFGRVMRNWTDPTAEKGLGKLDAGEKLFPRMAQGVEGGIAYACRFFIGFRSMSENNSGPSVLSKEIIISNLHTLCSLLKILC